ncbi:MAG: tetratricopeptide repeat protein [Bacteroidales bacterium]
MKKHLIFILFILSSLTGISQSAEKLLERGRNALINKDYVNAINEFTASLQKGESYEAYYSRGISFYSLKDYNKALDDFDSAINIENKGVAYFWKGCTNYQLKKYNEALADLNKATELNYDDSDSLWKMYSYWQLFQFENVILEATKLITNSPTEMAYYFRGYSYRQLNNNNSAKQDANTLIDKFPDSHRGYLLIGYLYFDERKYDLAIQILEIALSKDATKATILHELARAYYYKKEYTKSLTKINEVILIDSNSTYYLFKGRVYYYGLHNTNTSFKT